MGRVAVAKASMNVWTLALRSTSSVRRRRRKTSWSFLKGREQRCWLEFLYMSLESSTVSWLRSLRQAQHCDEAGEEWAGCERQRSAGNGRIAI